MKSKYSYFDQLCALSYGCMMMNHPTSATYRDIKRCSDILNNR